MKNVTVLTFQPPSNLLDFKILWVKHALHIANSLYSKEVKVTNSFFNEIDPLLISCNLDEFLKTSGDDVIVIAHNMDCDLIDLMTKAFKKTDLELKRRFTLVHINDDKVKTLVSTNGVYNNEICYTNFLKLQAPAIESFLASTV